MRSIAIITVAAILLATAIQLKAANVGGTPPVYSDAALNTAINTAWADIVTEAIAEFEKYEDQGKLAKGFANSNTYAAGSASLEGYQDYSVFGIMTGAAVSVQLPSGSLSTNDIETMRQTIADDGDVNAGAGVGISIVNAGLNAGFIYPGLFVNLKFGYMSLNGKSINSELEGYTFKSMIYGIGLNQILFWPRNMIPGVFRWRGISIGTGFYYSKTETDIEILKSLITSNISGYSNTLILDPTFKICLNTVTMTVPLDIMTSFRFFSIFNFNLGTGVDFNYGYTEISLKASGSLYTDVDSGTATLVTPGSVKITGGTKKTKPSYYNPKIMAGIGFNFGIIKIDIPVTYYYLESGFAVGLSAGVAW